MADNAVMNAGVGGVTLRLLQDGGGIDWPAEVASFCITVSPGANALQLVDITHGLPVQPQTGSTWAATQSGAWNITNVSGTVSLPTGAATAAKQPALGTAGAAAADVITVQGIASMTALKTDGSGVTQPVSGTVTANLGTVAGLALDATLTGGTAKTLVYDGTNTVFTSTHPGYVQFASAQAVTLTSTTITGTVAVTQSTSPWVVSLASTVVSGTVAATQSGTWTVQPGNTANTTPWLVQDVPGTANGLDGFTFLSTAAVQTNQIKGSAGQIYSMEFFNTGATPVYVRLYDQTGAPANTDTTNIIWRGLIPGNTAGAGFVKSWEKGRKFATGIGIRVTGAVADNDNTALAANSVIGNVEYK